MLWRHLDRARRRRRTIARAAHAIVGVGRITRSLSGGSHWDLQRQRQAVAVAGSVRLQRFSKRVDQSDGLAPGQRVVACGAKQRRRQRDRLRRNAVTWSATSRWPPWCNEAPRVAATERAGPLHVASVKPWTIRTHWERAGSSSPLLPASHCISDAERARDSECISREVRRGWLSEGFEAGRIRSRAAAQMVPIPAIASSPMSARGSCAGLIAKALVPACAGRTFGGGQLRASFSPMRTSRVHHECRSAASPDRRGNRMSILVRARSRS